MIHGLLPYWLGQGHRVVVSEGPPKAQAQADVVFLHVDASVVADEYLEATRRFPVVVNAAGTDIRKSVLSELLVLAGDAWTGPVIVKSDLNAGGMPEVLLNEQARRMGCDEPYPGVAAVPDYPIFRCLADVPERVWRTPGLVVEKFLPEQDEHGFWTTFWLFLGSRSRCRRFCSRHPIVKAGASILREDADVPDEVRAVRERLGLDYGKIDFVMHGGRPIVLDINRTPAPTPPSTAKELGTAEILAPGIEEFLARA